MSSNVYHIETSPTLSRNQMDKLVCARSWKVIAKIKSRHRIAVRAGVPPEKRILHSHLFAYMIRCGPRRFDPTNLVASLKWIEDAVVKCGILKDDSAKHITWMGSFAECRSKSKWCGFRGPRSHLLLSEQEEAITEYIEKQDKAFLGRRKA